MGDGMMDGRLEFPVVLRADVGPGREDRPVGVGRDDRSPVASDGAGQRPNSAAVGASRQRISWSVHAGIAVNGIICALVRRPPQRQDR